MHLKRHSVTFEQLTGTVTLIPVNLEVTQQLRSMLWAQNNPIFCQG